MPDEPFFKPGLKPPPPRVPQPGELVWALRKDSHTYTCELRYHGEWGVEAQILKDGDLLVAYRQDTKALAVQWAEEERKDLEQKGEA